MPAAPTYYSLSDNETRQGWERELHYEVISRVGFLNPEYGLIGDKPSSVCQRKKEQFKRGGTRTRITLLRQLRGLPTTGNTTMREKEEGLDTETFDFDINKSRHAVLTDGEIVDQRVTWDTLEEAKVKMGEWWAIVLEAGIMCHLTGFTINAGRTYEWWLRGDHLGMTGHNVPTAPDALHLIRPNALTTDEAVGLDPTATLDVRQIDRCIALAKTLPLPIRPMMYKGNSPMYAMLLHTYHVNHLRDNFSDWFVIMQNALKGGAFDDNPLFTGALGYYNGTLFIESRYLPPGIHSTAGTAVGNTRRAVFVGAQAMVLGLGKRYASENQFKTVGENFDYADKYGVETHLIYGLAAPKYTLSEDGASHDFAKIVVTAYAEDLVSTS